ncbi:hypothetical protein P4S95_10625 [Aneurinibacillus aneurinilyticus]|uniref:hypothetical protein n=1 Tax=Aneurinibacillus aneurinilyticus TaxID=1391 RepID=UPI002E2331E3|nr:hypothetical protein [Aneurinibacillus aneurinilyticus]
MSRSKAFLFVVVLGCFWLLFRYLEGGEQTMALIATTLIVRGKMAFSEVPTTLKDQVRQMLNDIDMDQLIEEKAK